MGHMAGMLTVRRRPGQQHQSDAARNNRPHRSAADTPAGWTLFVFNAAWAHHTKTATYTAITELALRLLRDDPVKSCYYAFLLGDTEHFYYSRVDRAFEFLRLYNSWRIRRPAGMAWISKPWHYLNLLNK
jgi:hypothetical protein